MPKDGFYFEDDVVFGCFAHYDDSEAEVRWWKSGFAGEAGVVSHVGRGGRGSRSFGNDLVKGEVVERGLFEVEVELRFK